MVLQKTRSVCFLVRWKAQSVSVHLSRSSCASISFKSWLEFVERRGRVYIVQHLAADSLYWFIRESEDVLNEPILLWDQMRIASGAWIIWYSNLCWCWTRFPPQNLILLVLKVISKADRIWLRLERNTGRLLNHMLQNIYIYSANRTHHHSSLQDDPILQRDWILEKQTNDLKRLTSTNPMILMEGCDLTVAKLSWCRFILRFVRSISLAVNF